MFRTTTKWAIAFFLSLASLVSARSIESFQEVVAEFDQLDSQALIVFDVDQVLITSEDAILTGRGDALRRQLILEEMSHLSPQQLAQISKWIQLIYLSPKKRLLEASTPELIRSLQQRGIKVIALTNCRTGPYGDLPSVEQWRIDGLNFFGINFSPAFPESKRLVLHTLTEPGKTPPLFQEGILFSFGYTKGEVLRVFLKELQYTPSKVLFFDDLEENVTSVTEVLTQEQIPIEAHLYLSPYSQSLLIDEEIARLQLRTLVNEQKWLSDIEARQLIEGN